MKVLGEGERLPTSVGGLVDFGLSGWFAHAPLYLGLALAVVAIAGAVTAFVPARSELGLAQLLIALEFIEIFGYAVVVAAVALGVARRARAGAPVTGRALLGNAVERWLPVLGTMIVVNFVLASLTPLAGLGFTTRPPGYVFVTAPVIWFFCGIVALAGPLAALTGERAALAMLAAFGRAIGFSFRRGNLPGLCVVAFATIVPTLLAEVLFDLLTKQHVPHAVFWANLPVDALTVGPVTAIQTAFVLDFARRAQRDANA